MMMKVQYFCFVVAASAALVGMSVGVFMGLSHDFRLAPAHAHLNLLGWVTMSLYGLYHRGRERAATMLSWIQAGAGAVGFVCMAAGIALILTSSTPAALPVALGGAFICILSMLLFLIIVATDAWRASSSEGKVHRRLLQAVNRA